MYQAIIIIVTLIVLFLLDQRRLSFFPKKSREKSVQDKIEFTNRILHCVPWQGLDQVVQNSDTKCGGKARLGSGKFSGLSEGDEFATLSVKPGVAIGQASFLSKLIKKKTPKRARGQQIKITSKMDILRTVQEEIDTFPKGKKVESGHYLIRPQDDNAEDNLTHMTTGLQAIGMPGAEDYLKFFSKRGYQNVMFAIDRESQQPFWRLMVEKLSVMPDQKWTSDERRLSHSPYMDEGAIFHDEDVFLNRPAASYLPSEVLQAAFGTDKMDDLKNIKTQELAMAIVEKKIQSVITPSYRGNGQSRQFEYFPVIWDAVATKRSYHRNDEVLALPHLLMNTFRNGQFYGSVHPHFDYPEEFWENGLELYALRKKFGKERVLTLPSPSDIGALSQSAEDNYLMGQLYRKQPLQTRLVLEGVVSVIDDKVRSVSFFDTTSIAQKGNTAEIEKITSRALKETDKPREMQDSGVLIDFFDTMESIVVSELPYYVGDRSMLS